MVKEFLSQRGIGFKEYDVSRDPAAAQELVRNTGQMGVPVTVINGQTIVGFDRNQLEQALSQQQRPSLGASVADASKVTARYGTGITLGAFVGRVRPGSLAERLGLSAGDVIVELNMQRIANADDLERATSRLNKGSRVSLVFVRGDKEFTAEGTL
ncbi:MAG: glutaredoxin domain-containing protein [Candidatus Thorarchaeota archaeon]|jgi:glutaredoxin